jgi:hypothetical protein
MTTTPSGYTMTCLSGNLNFTESIIHYPPLYPFILHETPENLNEIQLGRRLRQIEYLQILAPPLRYLCLNCTTCVVTGVIHHNHCLSGKTIDESIKESDDYITINIFFCSVSYLCFVKITWENGCKIKYNRAKSI